MNQDEKPPKPIYVYVLTDPRYPDDVRYVGVTAYPQRRIKEHIYDAKNGKKNHRANWINSLLRDGIEPIMTTIDETNNEEWQQCEIGWIAYYRDLGCNLVNGVDGGIGVRGIVYSVETRRGRSLRMSGEGNPNYGKTHSEETRKRISENNPRKKAVLQYDKFGHFIREWDSAFDASKTLSIEHANIHACCLRRGRVKSAGGYIWRFASDPILGIPPTQLKLNLE